MDGDILNFDIYDTENIFKTLSISARKSIIRNILDDWPIFTKVKAIRVKRNTINQTNIIFLYLKKLKRDH